MPGSTDFIGTISLFANHNIPKGWLACNGQKLKIHEYEQSLWPVIGTKFGGLGDEFLLPNLNGRTPLGSSINFPIGSRGGEESVKLNKNQVGHNHTVNCIPKPEGDNYVICPGSALFSEDNHTYIEKKETIQRGNYSNKANSKEAMNKNTLLPFGKANNEGHNNMQPYLSLVFCICVKGIYPPRNENENGDK